jgi:hypothetical protein
VLNIVCRSKGIKQTEGVCERGAEENIWTEEGGNGDRLEKLHNLYASPNIIRVIKSMKITWEGHVALMGQIINIYQILIGKPEGKSPLGRLRCGWEGNIRMDIREVGREGVDWIHLA